MPRVIRKALVNEWLASEEVGEALRDLALAGGVRVRIMTALGEEVCHSGLERPPGVCNWMAGAEASGRICTRTIHEVMEGSVATGTCARVCPAGLWEAAVPIWMAGGVLGYVVLGQVADGAPAITPINRWRHALEREGIGVTKGQLERLRRATPVIDRERFAAILRMARRMVRHLEWLFERGFSEGTHHRNMPGSIRRALVYIKNHYDRPLTLADLARETSMSRQHFCTLFHRSTGMGFTHYLNWLRVEEACRLLIQTDNRITEVAFRVGFQSLSQFNRVFRQIRKCSPRNYRRECEASRLASESRATHVM